MSDTNETATAAADKSVKKPAPKDVMMTPEDHARATGNTAPAVRRVVFGGATASYEKFSAAHNAAAVMHGWTHHEHEFGQQLELGRAAYLKALEAAGNGDAPHAPAASKVLELRASRAKALDERTVKGRQQRAKRREEERRAAATKPRRGR